MVPGPSLLLLDKVQYDYHPHAAQELCYLGTLLLGTLLLGTLLLGILLLGTLYLYHSYVHPCLPILGQQKDALTSRAVGTAGENMPTLSRRASITTHHQQHGRMGVGPGRRNFKGAQV